MKKIPVCVFLTVLSLAIPGLSSAALSESQNIQLNTTKQPEMAQPTEQQWNLKDVEIRTLIEQMAKFTQKNFIIDPKVSGKVTLVTSQPLSKEESYQAFLSVLQVYGYSAVENANVIKIIPNGQAKTQVKLAKNTWSTDSGELDSMIVKVIHVHYVPVNTLAEAITPLVSSDSFIKAYTETNDIIIADYSSNVSGISQLINQIDIPSSENKIDVVKLNYAEPDDIANVLSSMLSEKDDGTPPIRVAADDRINSLLVSGSLFQRIKMRALISNLDKPTSATDEGTQVIYLTYIQAKDLAPILANIIEDYDSKQNEQLGKKEKISAAQPVANAISQKTTSSSSASLPTIGNKSMEGQSNTLSSLSTEGVNAARDEDSRARSGAVTTAVQWEETTNAVIIRAPKDLMRSLKSVIAKLDVRRMEVLVEVVIAEVQVDRARELGVEWNTNGNDVKLGTRFPSAALSNIQGPLGGPGYAAASGAATTAGNGFTPGAGMTLGFYDSGDLQGIIRALASDSASDILATPNIVTLDNEVATIKVGALVPFAIGESTDNLNAGGTPFTSFEREEVGLVLTIRPQITASGEVIMRVDHTLSNVIPGSAANNTSGNPTTSERVITTNVMVGDGQTLVLGGLIQEEYQDQVDKVPFLGDIPIIGNLFKSQSKKNVKRNLMIFLRPHIIANRNSGVIISGERYEQIRNAQMDSQTVLRRPYRPTSPSLQPLEPIILPEPFFMAANAQTNGSNRQGSVSDGQK